MKTGNTAVFRIRRFAALLLLAVTAFSLLPPSACAQGTRKTVRVGWDEPPFNIMDANGRRSGYAYEYQQKIAAYTGWDYEFVEGSWPELMEMLERGEIDLMSDVSYTPERTETMQFSDLPMGTEEYYIYVTPENNARWQGSYTALDGKRIGVLGSSIQKDILLAWAAEQGIRPELAELDLTEQDMLRLLAEGVIDALVTLDVYADPRTAVPYCKIGSSDFFFAVSKTRPDLLTELNQAMNKIQTENRFYNWELYETYLHNYSTIQYLDEDELAWLAAHGAIRVGYQDNYLAFCASDEDGALTGALKDYLASAAVCLENAALRFEPVAYAKVSEAMEALANGEVDCVFPVNLTDYDADAMGALLSATLMHSEVYAVVRSAEHQSFVYKERVTVAVNQGSPNYDMFLLEHHPDWDVRYYSNIPACLNAVASGEADCLLISNYRFNNISKQCAKLRLSTLATGMDIDYSFATRKGDTALYSILARTCALVPTSTVNAALAYYSAEDVKISFTDYLREYLAAVIALIAAVALVIMALVLKNLKTERNALANRQLITAVERDELTGLYSRNFFLEYADRFHKEHPEKRMDAIVLDIEQFHSVNELNGREFGNRVLRALGEAMLAFLEETEGIGGRFEDDHFDLFCAPQPDYQALLNRFQETIDRLSHNATIRLRMGVMPGTDALEAEQLFDRARTANHTIRGSKRHLMIYDEEMERRENRNHRLLNDFGRALREREFKVYYQPKYNIQREPPLLSSAEALIRWQHPAFGMVPPAEFIPLFEGTGQITELDKYVWRESARQIAAWRAQLGVTVPVSVNLSRVDILDPALEETLESLMAEYALERPSFKLEVTESAYTENAEQLRDTILRLRALGYEIEIDDFGSGYSSLSMLSSMPIDVLKMDRAFIERLEHSEKDARLVEAILSIARILKVLVVAEGVENEAQLTLLRRAGCELVQGYYFSRPLPPEDFEKLIPIT